MNIGGLCNIIEKNTKEGFAHDKEMLEEMDESCWGHEIDENSSYEEVKEEYNEMIEEFSDDSDMFPNGRDYDVEDEDGI